MQTNQAQTQQTLANMENVLRDAQAKQRTAETNVKTTNEKLVAKRQNIHETEGLVVQQQQQFQAKQAEHAAKQKTAQETKNNVIIIDQDISLATKTKVELKKEKKTQENMLQTEQKKREQLNTEQQQLKAQVNEHQVLESGQLLRQKSEELQQCSDQVFEQQQAYDGQNHRQTQFDARIEQYRAVKERLESHIDEMNSRWISKQMWVSSATKNLTELHQDISNIKITSQELVQTKFLN